MAHVCPWWGGYFIDNRIRRLLHNPEKIVGPYIQPGMTVMDVGCGMGLFVIAMAKMVGEQGRLHVSGKAFEATVALAAAAGLRTIQEPKVRWCRAVVFERAAT